MNLSSYPPLPTLRFTVSEYHRMFEIGIFTAESNVELIDGEIVQMSRLSPLHARVNDNLTRILHAHVHDLGRVSARAPLRLDNSNEPVPDVAVTRNETNEALLVIEVADAALDYCREIKASLYARFSVPELWIVNIIDRVLTRYTDPVAGCYGVLQRYSLADAVDITATDGGLRRIAVRDLFA